MMVYFNADCQSYPHQKFHTEYAQVLLLSFGDQGSQEESEVVSLESLKTSLQLLSSLYLVINFHIKARVQLNSAILVQGIAFFSLVLHHFITTYIVTYTTLIYTKITKQ